MATNHTDALLIARRYATAIFAEALAANKQDVVVDEFNTLAGAFRTNAELRGALSNPLVSRDAKAGVLAGLAQKGDAITQRAVGVIAEGGRSELLPEVANLLQQQLTEHRGELVAVVTSARPLSASVQVQLQNSLTKATGKQVEMRLVQDESVLGGLSVQLGSLKLDATLAGALNTMRTQLLASATTN